MFVISQFKRKIVQSINFGKRKASVGFLAILGAVPVVIITVLLVVQVVGSIGTVYNTMYNATTQPEAYSTTQSVMNNAWNGIAMVPIVVIILFASVILGAIGLLGLR